MAQAAALIDTLKRALRSHGLTYAHVASELGMSEASIKRMFAQKHFTLERLDSICRLMEMELTDLLRQFEEEQQRISHLTHEQEQELVSDVKLLLVAVLVRGHWKFMEIVQQYEISESECIRYLARLDRLGLVELLPKNRFKLRIDEDFRWLPGGPIEKFYERAIEPEFLAGGFKERGQRRLFLSGMLSPGAYDLLLRKLDELAKEFALLRKQDMGLPLEEKRNTGLMLAMRFWELSVFKSLRREATS